ncbi:MAG: hypothetical protein QW356_07655 [Candidatus Hadarchaeales archaeon]
MRARSRSIRHDPTPLLGINTNIVGFLCELDVKRSRLRLAEGRYTIEGRTRISTVLDSRKLPDALNDMGLLLLERNHQG